MIFFYSFVAVTIYFQVCFKSIMYQIFFECVSINHTVKLVRVFHVFCKALPSIIICQSLSVSCRALKWAFLSIICQSGHFVCVLNGSFHQSCVFLLFTLKNWFVYFMCFAWALPSIIYQSSIDLIDLLTGRFCVF